MTRQGHDHEHEDDEAHGHTRGDVPEGVGPEVFRERLRQAAGDDTAPDAHIQLDEQAVVLGDIDPQRYQDEDMIIIGTPEMCLEKFLRYQRADVDQLLCYAQFGNLPHDKVMRSLELLGTHVIPELEARGHRVGATPAAGAPALA